MREATFADIPTISGWHERDFGEAADFTGFLSHGGVCLIEGAGAAFFFPMGPGAYETHVMFEHRGKAAVELAHRMLDYIKRSRGAHRFVACVPDDNRKVKLFVRSLGWKSLGHENGHEIFQSE